MALMTARYANRNLNDTDRFVAVQASQGRPRYPLGYPLAESLRLIAPSRRLFGMDHDEFEVEYRKQLDVATMSAIRYELEKMQKKHPGKHLVLLCFEDVRKEDDWRHRTMFGKWWAERTGEFVPELEEPGKAPKKKLVQGTLL